MAASSKASAPSLPIHQLPTGEIFAIALDLGTTRSALSIWVEKDHESTQLDVCPETQPNSIQNDCKVETVLVFSNAAALGTSSKPLTVDSPATNAMFNRASVQEDWVNIGPFSISAAEDCIRESKASAYSVRDFKMQLDVQSNRGRGSLSAIKVTALPLHEEGEPIEVDLQQVMTAYIACAARIAFVALAMHVQRNPKLTMPTKDDVNWVITVPAIWTDQARIFMRRMAHAAGLSKKVYADNITICLEPEGAVLEAIKTDLIRNPDFLIGKSILVLDWGGGTCDITFSTVRSSVAQKVAELEEIEPAIGGPYGGRMLNEYVNEIIFRAWFGQEIFDNTWIKLGYRDRFFRNVFEPVKIAALDKGWRFTFRDLFEGNVPHQDLLGRLEAYNAGRGDDEKIVSGTTRLSPWFEIPFAQVKKCFNACIDPVLRLIEPLVKHSKLPPEHIFVVGGMGQSPYLKQYLMNSYLPEGKLVFPKNASMSIVRGAVRFALDTSSVIDRRARTNYGIEISRVGDSTPRWSLLIEKGQLLSEVASLKPKEYCPLYETQTQQLMKIVECAESLAAGDPLTSECYWVTEVTLRVNMSVPFKNRTVSVAVSMSGPVISGTITDINKPDAVTPIEWSSR